MIKTQHLNELVDGSNIAPEIAALAHDLFHDGRDARVMAPRHAFAHDALDAGSEDRGLARSANRIDRENLHARLLGARKSLVKAPPVWLHHRFYGGDFRNVMLEEVLHALLERHGG